AGGDGYVALLSLMRSCRRNDALAAARTLAEAAPGTFPALIVAARALIEDDAAASIAALDEARSGSSDPEMFFYSPRHYAHFGATGRALDSLAGSVNGGYFGLWDGRMHAWFDPIRPEPAFTQLAEKARRGRAAADAAYEHA